MEENIKQTNKKGLSDEDLIKKYESGKIEFVKLLKKVILKQTTQVHHTHK